ARAGARPGGAAIPGSAGADRRPDRDQALGQRRRPRGEPGGRAAADRGRGGGGHQPALPLQAGDPPDRDGQPGDRAGGRREDRDQRGLPLGAGPARVPGAPRGDPGPLPRPRRRRAHRRQARAHGGDVSTRGRSPRRGAVRGPRRPADARDLGPLRAPPTRRFRGARPGDRRAVRIVSAGASTYWCELAWLGGESVDEGVTVDVDGERITGVATGVADPPPGASRLDGITIPGLANAHSHAFQRALRGRTQAGRGDFWTWREAMYELASRLDPDLYLRLARATYGEMALAGITCVGEFHYLHH